MNFYTVLYLEVKFYFINPISCFSDLAQFIWINVLNMVKMRKKMQIPHSYYIILLRILFY